MKIYKKIVSLFMLVFILSACTPEPSAPPVHVTPESGGTMTPVTPPGAGQESSKGPVGPASATPGTGANGGLPGPGFTAPSAETSSSDQSASAASSTLSPAPPAAGAVAEDGTYQTKNEVAQYIHLYGHLPSNYITKEEASKLGWVSSLGNLRDVAPGKSIGGDKFGNREGLLPTASARKYYECDIDYEGGPRNAKRIVFSNDGLIFFTDDHYASFEQLY